jgi:hypothetical protein
MMSMGYMMRIVDSRRQDRRDTITSVKYYGA